MWTNGNCNKWIENRWPWPCIRLKQFQCSSRQILILWPGSQKILIFSNSWFSWIKPDFILYVILTFLLPKKSKSYQTMYSKHLFMWWSCRLNGIEMATIEAIFLSGVPDVKLEPTTATDDDCKTDEPQNSMEQRSQKHKIGEVFRLSPFELTFACIHCSAEFSHLFEFTAHIEQHLKEIVATNLAKSSEEVGTSITVCEANKLSSDAIHVQDNRESEKKFNQLIQIGIKDEEVDQSETLKAKSPKPQAAKQRLAMQKRSKASKTTSAAQSKEAAATSFRCSICNKDCKFPSRLKIHERSHLTYKCDQCPRTFMLKGALDNHIKNHEKKLPSKSFECYLCHKTCYSSAVSCRFHMRVEHWGTIFPCKRCGYNFSRAAELQQHTAANDCQPQCIECVHCLQSFPNQRLYNQHAVEVHNTKSPYIRDKYKLRTCKLCQEQFHDVNLFDRHKRWHRKQQNYRPYKCDVCEKDFTERRALQWHMDAHNKVARDVTCDICHKTLYKRYLKVHMKLHTAGGKSHQCTVCGRLFAQYHRIKVHMRTHTREQPFECDICLKRFRQKHNLTVHRRLHTGEFIYKCSPCDKGFSARKDWRKHNLKVHAMTAEEAESAMSKVRR